MTPTNLWAASQIRLGLVLRWHCEKAWSIDAAWSSALVDLDLWVILSGQGQLTSEGRVTELRPGVGVLFQPGKMYHAEQDPERRLVFAAVHFELFDAEGEVLPRRHLPAEVFRVPDLAMAEAVTRRIYHRYLDEPDRSVWANDAVAAQLLAGLLMDLESENARVADMKDESALKHREFALRVEARLRENPAEAISIPELAAEMGLSLDYFSRIFRKATGRPPQAAVIEARIERARQLLTTTPMSISDVAAALNYTSVQYFSRQFSQVTGLSPRSYLKRHRGQERHRRAGGGVAAPA